MTNQQYEKARTHNWRFGAMAALARRNGSAILEVSFPPEPLWKPPLRQAARAFRYQFARLIFNAHNGFL